MKKFLTTCVALACLNVSAKPEHLSAKSYLLVEDNKVLEAHDVETVRSIASVTKLMTVLVVLEANQDLTERIKYKNLVLSRLELVNLALVHSDNLASTILCNNYTTGYQDCIRRMNYTAHELGMSDTKYVDPTGLSTFNVSSANDLLKLLNKVEQNQIFIDAAKLTTVTVPGKKPITYRNTNPLIGTGIDFLASKTGTTKAAGGCIVLSIRTETGIRRLIILGSKNARTRIPEAQTLLRIAS